MGSLLNTSHDLMLDSLELLARTDTDIVPAYFARLFAAYPDQEANFHNRATSQGNMVNEMASLLLSQAANEPWVPMFMRAQVLTHHDHGDIALRHYQASLGLLVDTLAEAVGPAWTPDHDHAWRGEASKLYAMIEACY